jgi:hypothetical protein
MLGIILAIVLAAAAYVGGSWGFVRLHAITASMTSGALLHDKHALLAMAALAGVALLAGLLLVVPRVSPLAPGLPGLVLIAWTVLYVLSVKHATSLIPLRSHDFGRGFAALLADGALGAAGIALIVPLFVPSRWRRPSAPADPIENSALLSDFDPTATTIQLPLPAPRLTAPRLPARRLPAPRLTARRLTAPQLPAPQLTAARLTAPRCPLHASPPTSTLAPPAPSPPPVRPPTPPEHAECVFGPALAILVAYSLVMWRC